MGPPWGHLGASGDYLGPSWGHLGEQVTHDLARAMSKPGPAGFAEWLRAIDPDGTLDVYLPVLEDKLALSRVLVLRSSPRPNQHTQPLTPPQRLSPFTAPLLTFSLLPRFSLGPSWDHLGASGGYPGPSYGHPRAILEPHWPTLVSKVCRERSPR